MKKYILPIALITGSLFTAQAQIQLTKTLPPVGAKLTIYQAASSTLARPASGANQVWDYSAVSPSLQFNLETKALSSVAQKYQDSCPTAKYVEVMNVSGAPSPDYLPMEFFEDKGNYMVRVGQKGTNLNLEKKNDTVFVFNLAYGSGEVYTGSFREYAGYGTLKIGTDVYDSVVMIKSKSVENTTSDTGYHFFKITPYWTRLASVMFLNGQSVGMSYWKPSIQPATGLTEYLRLAPLKVYPNPASDWLHVDAHYDRLVITNMQGQVTLETTSAIEQLLNISTWPEGIYLIRSFHQGQQVTQKLIKQ